MTQDINILSYAKIDKSGFLRIGAVLPSGNTEQLVSITGINNSSGFIAFDKIKVCSSIFIDVNPKIIFIDNDFSIPGSNKITISDEKLEVRFTTKDFTPTNIYVALNILSGDKIFHKANYPELEIKDFEYKNNNNFMEFSFMFPQGNKKLSDYININNIKKSFTMSLVIVLEFRKDNYFVNNQYQLSPENLVNNFAFPIKCILYKDCSSVIVSDQTNPYRINFVAFEERGDENIEGFINCKLDLSFSPYYYYLDRSGFIPNDILYNSNTGFTEISFSAATYHSNINSSTDAYFNNQSNIQYDYNDTYNLLKNGTLILINRYNYDTNKCFSIEKSNISNNKHWIYVRGDITKDISNYNNNLIVCSFFATHYRIKSERDCVSDIRPLLISKNDPITNNSFSLNNYIFKYETIAISGNIIDNKNLYVELIDDINNTSIMRKLKIDKSKITTKLTSDIEDSYFVSCSFFKNYSKIKYNYNITGDNAAVKTIFWNPIVTSYDGFIGIYKNLNEFYIKLVSNYFISGVTGYVNCLNTVALNSTSISGDINENIDFDENYNVLVNEKEAYIRIRMSDIINVSSNTIESDIYITANITIENTEGSIYTIKI